MKKMVLIVLNEARLSDRISEASAAQEVGDDGIIEDSIAPKSLKDCEDFSLEDGKRSSWLHHREVSDIGAEVRKRNEKTKGCAFGMEETELSSQDPSPVSVIDFDHFIITTSEEDAKLGDSNSRRTLSPQLDNQNHKHYENLIFVDRNSKKTEEPRKKVCHDPDNPNMWVEACKLTETLVVATNWNAYKNVCKFEEISADYRIHKNNKD